MESIICRFAVGSPDGPRSSTYRIWTDKSSSDVYIAARTSASEFTARIHAPRPEKGMGQAGHAVLTRAQVRKAIAGGTWGGDNCFMGNWSGKEVAPEIVQHFVVHIPGSGLRVFREARDAPDEPTWISAPPEFGQVTVTVLLGPGHVTWQPNGDGMPQGLLGEGELSDGRKIMAVYFIQEAPSPLQTAGMFSAIRKRQAPNITQERLMKPSMRVVLVCEMDGAGMFVELAGDMFSAPGSC